jgi:hypothetical protein
MKDQVSMIRIFKPLGKRQTINAMTSSVGTKMDDCDHAAADDTMRVGAKRSRDLSLNGSEATAQVGSRRSKGSTLISANETMISSNEQSNGTSKQENKKRRKGATYVDVLVRKTTKIAVGSDSAISEVTVCESGDQFQKSSSDVSCLHEGSDDVSGTSETNSTSGGGKKKRRVGYKHALYKIWHLAYLDKGVFEQQKLQLSQQDVLSLCTERNKPPAPGMYVLPRLPKSPISPTNAVLVDKLQRKHLLALWKLGQNEDDYKYYIQKFDVQPVVGSNGGSEVESDCSPLVGSNGGSEVQSDGSPLVGSNGGSEVQSDGSPLVRSNGGPKAQSDVQSVFENDGGPEVQTLI